MEHDYRSAPVTVGWLKEILKNMPDDLIIVRHDGQSYQPARSLRARWYGPKPGGFRELSLSEKIHKDGVIKYGLFQGLSIGG